MPKIDLSATAEFRATLPPAPAQAHPIVVTGATGYIGGRLVRWLLELGWRVRVLVRSPAKLSARPWAEHPRLEAIVVDLEDPSAIASALDRCPAAYYLIHSMNIAGRAFHARDVHLATAFRQAATRAGVGRIIYLGGLGELGPDLSEHLSSRQEVASVLAAGGPPVTVLRAGVILGSGSASFEMVRYLVERLPAMITPRWVSTQCQPIAVRNVLHYLVSCLTTPATIGRTFDIGGPDILTYRELMQRMAGALGLRRRVIVPVPVLTPRLSSWWVHLVTPIHRDLAKPLAEGLRNRVVCRDSAVQEVMPQALLSVDEAIALALGRHAADAVETSWSDAGTMPGDPDWSGGTVLCDRRVVDTTATAEALFAAVSRIGGDHGWYATDALWRLRGALDRLVGGPGLRRGRRDQQRLQPGDAVDFWRVTQVEALRRIELAAEMRLPGEARLSWTIDAAPTHRRIVQEARFRPRGLSGLAYWYAVLPVHGVVFPRLLRGIVDAAEAKPATGQP